MAQTERRVAKALWSISTTGGGPLAGSSPKKAKRRLLVNYMLTQTYNSKCIRCTILSRSTPTNVTCSSPGMDSTPDASCTRKGWIPRPKRLSNERAAPSSRTVQKRAARIMESLAGIAPVPRSSATDRGGCRGGGSTVVGRRAKAGGRRRHWVHESDAWVERRFRDPSRGERTRVETLEWRIKALIPCFRISSCFWFPNFPLFRISTV